MAFILDSTGTVSMHEKIHRRSGHVAVLYKDWMIVWGGYVVNMKGEKCKISHKMFRSILPFVVKLNNRKNTNHSCTSETSLPPF